MATNVNPDIKVTFRLEVEGADASKLAASDLDLYTPSMDLVAAKQVPATQLSSAALLYFKTKESVDADQMMLQIQRWAETRMPGARRAAVSVVVVGAWPGKPTAGDPMAWIMNGIVLVSAVLIAKGIFPNWRIPVPRLTFRRRGRRRAGDSGDGGGGGGTFGRNEVEKFLRDRPGTAREIFGTMFTTTTRRPAERQQSFTQSAVDDWATDVGGSWSRGA